MDSATRHHRPVMRAVGGWGQVLVGAGITQRLQLFGDPRQRPTGKPVLLRIDLSGSTSPPLILTAGLVERWAQIIPPNVISFDLRGNKFVSDTVVDALGEMLLRAADGPRMVADVNLFGCRVSAGAVERLVLRCPTLIEVARCAFSTEIYNRGCHWIPRMFA
jgi:hypothetical protein